MRFVILISLASISLLAGCGSPAVENTANNLAANSNANINTSGGWTRIEPSSANSNSINVNRPTNSPKGTPTPGIDPANFNKPMKPGATPTPGIPSQEEIRRQLQNSKTLPANSSTNANGYQGPPMMSRKKQPTPVGNKTP